MVITMKVVIDDNDDGNDADHPGPGCPGKDPPQLWCQPKCSGLCLNVDINMFYKVDIESFSSKLNSKTQINIIDPNALVCVCGSALV